jgi:hypothetical protein
MAHNLKTHQTLSQAVGSATAKKKRQTFRERWIGRTCRLCFFPRQGGWDGRPDFIQTAPHHYIHSVSKPPLLMNFSVRLFSVTVRTTLSEAPCGISASISSVARTDDPTRPVRWVITSSAIPAGVASDALRIKNDSFPDDLDARLVVLGIDDANSLRHAGTYVDVLDAQDAEALLSALASS